MKPQRAVPTIAASPLAPADPESESEALLDSFGELADERALVLGPDIGIMCGMIRRGCEEVTELEQNQRPEAGRASLVIVSAVCSTDMAACVIAHARRGLMPAGRVVVRTAPDPSGQLGYAIERALGLHGFSLIRSRRAGGRAIFSAELPPREPTSPAMVELCAAESPR